MKFIDREKELRQLDALYHQPGFQMVVMYGRRRVGKTTLLSQLLTTLKGRSLRLALAVLT